MPIENIDEFRKVYPQYDDFSDEDVTRRLHEQYYSDWDFNKFANRFLAPKKSPLGTVPPDEMPSVLNMPEAMQEGINPPRGTGAMLGATIPAMAAAALIPGVNIAVPAALSLLGGAGGSLAEQKMEEVRTGQPVDIGEAAVSGVQGLAGETAGGILGSALKLAPEGAKGLQLAREAGLPTSASRYAKGWLPKTLQTIADWTPAGRGIESAYRSRLVGQVTQWRTDLVRKMMGLPVRGKAEIGLDIGESIKSMRDADVIYGQFSEVLNGLDQVMVPNSSQFLKDRGGMKIVREMGWGPSTPEYNTLKRVLINEEGIKGKEVSYLFAKVWRRFSKDSPYQAGLKDEMKTALIKDLDAYEASSNITLGELKRQGDEAWKNASEWLKQTPAAREVIRKLPSGTPYFEVFPGNVVDALFKPEKVNDLLKIKKVLADGGKQEVWDAAVAQQVEGMLSRATKADAVTGETTFMPAAFVEQYREARPMLEKLAPEIMPKLDEFAQVAKGAAPEFKMAKKEFPWLTFTGIYGAAGAGLGPVGGVAVPNGFGALAAWSLMGTDKAARFIQKWGIRGGAAGAKAGALPLKVGTIKGLQEVTEEE